MKVQGKPMRTIWVEAEGAAVGIIDQTRLPHELATRRIETAEAMAEAIRSMRVRGAPLIGAAAAYGVALALSRDAADSALASAIDLLAATRPTAINLRWALEEMRAAVAPLPPARRAAAAWARAGEIAEADIVLNRALGEHGRALIEQAWMRQGKSGRVDVLTHCNAGWLAAVDWGTALAPVFMAHDRGTPVHVWVDETRPRNQGASLTAWELLQHGVPHTVIADNAGGHLMQRGEVDLCIVGTDRTTAAGDVANKIGTYLKALAAHDNGVPFYVAAPSPSIDWSIEDGRSIPIEERASSEVTEIAGLSADGAVIQVRLTPAGSSAANPAFDVTPARLVTGLITERGVAEASREGLLALFPERRPNRAGS
jgi:methylthioribose-1-phosphate isomerase